MQGFNLWKHKEFLIFLQRNLLYLNEYRSFKEFGTQTNDLELDGAEWAPPGAGRPLGSAAPAVGPLVLLFRMLVVSVLCRNFVGCVSPTLCFCACRNTQDKIWHEKKLCRLKSGEFKFYYIEIKKGAYYRLQK